jgi:multidrug efflux pump subunit AcrA (membrane-fusion protein)
VQVDTLLHGITRSRRHHEALDQMDSYRCPGSGGAGPCALSARSPTGCTAQVGKPAQATVELLASDLVQVRMVELAQSLALSGPVKAVNSAVVKARVPGELQGLAVREGDFVKTGDVIARIDATEYQARVKQAQQQAESARAQVDIAKRSS